jgi:hypothetical protein
VLTLYHFETQAFLPSTTDMHCLDLAALYTLQYRLPRHAQRAHGLVHGKIAFRSFLGNALA